MSEEGVKKPPLIGIEIAMEDALLQPRQTA
jgi:hypothetical protein